jgi:tRNA threonylcarbamoyladenosine biosynthesis protein TsaB
MLVLALDTTTRGGSCALAREGVVVREQAGDASRPQAERLPGELMTLLEAEQLALRDVGVFAVAVGPGSFTGLRVGIATMQGLAFAAGKPLIGISALDALAASVSTPPASSRWIATWVDAWRGEVYAALYDHGSSIGEPTVEPPHQILGRLGQLLRADAGSPSLRPEGITFIGDGVRSHADAIRAVVPVATIAEPVAPLIAGTIARLATDAARRGHLPPPHAIRPLYVRRPDAELVRDARAGH